MNHISRKELLEKEYNKVVESKLPNILSLLGRGKEEEGRQSRDFQQLKEKDQRPSVSLQREQENSIH